MGQLDFSIIIPTYKRQPRLRALLESLVQQTFNHDRWEVIIVDDQSGENLKPLIESFSEKLCVHCITSQVKGRPGARNTGVRKALGKTLVFLDDDLTVHTSFLEELEIAHKERPGCLVVGKIVSGDDDRNLWVRIINRRFDLHQKHLKKNPKDLPFYCVTTGNLSIDKDIFNSVGGFDEQLFQKVACEDFDFGKRCHDAGIKIIYNPNSIAKHFEGNFKVTDLFHGARSMAYGTITLLNKHKDILRDYENYRSFPVQLGRTYFPQQSWLKKFIKNIICLPPFLEIAAWIITMAWWLKRSKVILNICVKLKEMIELRYYMRAAADIWKE